MNSGPHSRFNTRREHRYGVPKKHGEDRRKTPLCVQERFSAITRSSHLRFSTRDRIANNLINYPHFVRIDSRGGMSSDRPNLKSVWKWHEKTQRQNIKTKVIKLAPILQQSRLISVKKNTNREVGNNNKRNTGNSGSTVAFPRIEALVIFCFKLYGIGATPIVGKIAFCFAI